MIHIDKLFFKPKPNKMVTHDMERNKEKKERKKKKTKAS